MDKVYYSAKGYWKGYAAIEKLAQEAQVSEADAKKWLEKQALWQIYLSPPEYIPRPRWTVSKPNQVHQADLLFLPHDTFKRKTYRYALVVIDVASRYKDAEALTSKDSSEIAKCFSKIYSRKLGWPEMLVVDPGREFMGSVTMLMKQHGVSIQRGQAGNHRSQAFVERANKTLSERLFSHQYAQEMISDKRSREWVKRLPQVLKSMNSEPTRLTGKEPSRAIELDKVTVKGGSYKRPVGLDETRLPPSVLVRYLYAPGEGEGGDRRRATDPIWSLGIHDLSRSVVSSDQPVLYYLSKGAPKRGFVREELQVVPDDTELPPKSMNIILENDPLIVIGRQCNLVYFFSINVVQFTPKDIHLSHLFSVGASTCFIVFESNVILRYTLFNPLALLMFFISNQECIVLCA